MSHVLALIREALASARSQPVASAVSIIIVAGMVAAVLLTTGRTVGSEQEVLSSIDSAGTRSIIVRAEASAGLDTTVISRLSNVDGISWMGALGPATDITNAAIPDGALVPSRLLWSPDVGELGIPATSPIIDRTAWASTAALERLGMIEAIGGVQADSGEAFDIAGRLDVPDYLAFLEPLIVVPQSSTEEPQPVSVLVVVANRPENVAPLSAIVASVLAVDDPTKVTVTTSERLAMLRALIEGQLGSFGRALVLLIFGLSALLVAAIFYGLVMLRRKDFGRRRALGASQRTIVALLMLQVAVLSVVGALLGAAMALATLAASGDPLPGASFTTAIIVLAVGVAVGAGLLPAIAAARREPISELRVP